MEKEYNEYKDATEDLRNIIGRFENEESAYAAVNLCLAVKGKKIFSPFLREFEDSSPDDVIRTISIEEVFKMAMRLLAHRESITLPKALHGIERWIIENGMTNRGNYEIDEYRYFKFVLTTDLIKRWTKQLAEEK